MILYTSMPIERVMEGWENGPGPLIEIEHTGMTMLLSPLSPGVGRLVRLVSAPLETYLNPSYAPGSLIYYGAEALSRRELAPSDYQTSSIM
ncbi:YlzJ-like family protein [Cohnella thailandensis]|uniref:YlzJ-like family protein n=1 Tax=Cohnella thailandensis TaxID=557557 RepID=A0A841SWJ4_9BACL|nr:YlzJ-like family protein [Cohnella thailandensis]MBB6635329.1 YlzJ-like family protein [Cohnella thailandensis]MBP1974708.1 hypothetical protein [Cohnella thailandensis]